MKHLKQNICQTLSELNAVICQLEAAQYCQSLPIFSGSTIGMHSRHIIEFYQTLLTQFTDNQSVNYDKRERDLSLQTDLMQFSEAIENIIQSLENLDDDRLNHPLSIASEDSDNLVLSSLARELQYNLEHTIHHAAIIKIGILSMNPALEMPASFGVAPSTLRYQLTAVSNELSATKC